jgi:polyisoprenoid-binding protein YceI
MEGTVMPTIAVWSRTLDDRILLPRRTTDMATQRWNIDSSHSGVHFTVRHMVISKVRGAFARWQGEVDFDAAAPAASTVAVRIDAASIDTHEPKRDDHLRSADFLDVAQHPALTFTSTKVEPLPGDRYRVIGDLTIRGVTRQVELAAELLGGGKDPWGNERIGFQATTAISRKDFGLIWNQALETGGVLVGDRVDIALDVQAVKAQAAERAA